MACSLYGANVFGSALTKVCTEGPLFEMTMYSSVSNLLSEQKAFINMYEAFGHELNVVPVGQSAPFPGGFQQLIWNNFLEKGSLAPGGANARWIPYVNTGLSTELERVYDVDWKYIDKLKNTIEPFVNYDYVPDISQSAVPLFDEREDQSEIRS